MMTTGILEYVSLDVDRIELPFQEHLPTLKVPSPTRADPGLPKTLIKERELIHALRQGDEAAFTSLVEQYHTRLTRLARTFVPSQAVAEEVVQETWIAILQGINRFEGRSSLKTWIFQILSNLAKSKGRRENRYVSMERPATDTDEDSDHSPRGESRQTPAYRNTEHPTWDEKDPERLFLSKEGMAQLEQAIGTLPVQQRQVIILRDFEGMESEGICELLSISPTNQRVLLHRGRIKVRERLYQYLQEG